MNLIVQKAVRLRLFPHVFAFKTVVIFQPSARENFCALLNVFGIGLIEALNLNESAQARINKDP